MKVREKFKEIDLFYDKDKLLRKIKILKPIIIVQS